MKKFKKLFVIMLALPLALLISGCPGPDPGENVRGTVTSVSVLRYGSPVTAVINASKGDTLTFTAAVVVENIAARSVTWSLIGGSAGTTLSGGVLKIAATEADNAELKVTATSTADQTKRDTITIKVLENSAPVVKSVTFSPTGNAVTFENGSTLQFTVVVVAENGASEDLDWSITSTDHAEGTSISDTGVLTVAENETQTSITIKVASIEEGFQSVAATRTLKLETGEPRYTITVENGIIEGDTDEDGKYLQNAIIKFIADDRSNIYHVFVSWTLDGMLLSDRPEHTIRVTKDGHYVANFDIDPNYVPPLLEPGDPEFKNHPVLYRFYDDFSKGDAADNNMLDRTKWAYDEGGGGFGNDEIQYYTRDNIRIVDCDEIPGNRKVVMTMKRQNMGTRNFTSGKFWSRNNFASTYGKIEAKIRMWHKVHEAGLTENTNNTQGLWPAFWMMPASSSYGGWPRSGEIDIMEIRGRMPRQMNSTIHRRAGGPSSNGQTWVTMGSAQRSPTGTSTITGEPLLASYEGGDFRYADIENGIPGGSNASDWHVYCIEWDYDEERPEGEQIEFRWYVDDILTYTVKESHWNAFSDSGGFNGALPKPKPFDRDFYVIFNFALGGNFDGNRVPNGSGNNIPADAAIFAEDAPPVEYEIDWVVWREIMPRDGEPGGIQKPIYD